MIKRVLALIKYNNTDRIDAFNNGEELFSSNEVFQMIEDDGIAWDDLRLIDYSKKRVYDRDLQNFHDAKNELENYKVILLKPYSYFKDKYYRMKTVMKNKILSDDTSIRLDKTIKESPKQKRLRVEGNRPNMGNIKIVLDKSREQSRPINMVNLMKNREVAMYPPGYKGKQVSGSKASGIYGRIAYKLNTKHGNQFIFFSDVVNTIADNTGTATDWEFFAIVKYRSFESMRAFNTEPMFVRAFVHKDAGVEHTYVYAAFSE